MKPGAHVLALASVVGALLVGFVVIVVREVGATVGAWDGGSGDPYELFAVSLTGLVGAVFAVALGASHRPPPGGRRTLSVEHLQSWFGRVYVLAYSLAGGTALVVCLVRLSASTPLLRSLAATFLGTSVAAASAFFGLDAEAETETRSGRR